MFQVFDEPEFLSEQEAYRKYPDSLFIMQDIKDINNVEGYIIAVSTDKDSFRQICEKRDELSDQGADVILMGSYGGYRSGVTYIVG